MVTPAPSLRPPLPPGRLRVAAALLESGLLLVSGALFLSGQLQPGDERDEPTTPIRLGVRALPMLAVVGAYAVQRLTRPRRGAFVLAGSLVCAVSAALRAGLSPAERAVDGLKGLAVGAFMMALVLPLDGEAEELQGSAAQPWRELLFASFMLVFGSLPAFVAGGFLVAVPTVALGVWMLGRGALHDLRQLWRGGGRAGAAGRLAIGLPLGLLGVGLVVVMPRLSLGWQPR